MKKKRKAIFYFRFAMAVAALFLPLLSLALLGSVWLWQHGYVLYWALAACSMTLVTYAIERWVFRVDLPETAPVEHLRPGETADAGWSVREAAAWNAIVALSNQVRPLEITSRDEVFDLGVRAVETVARSMYPGEEHALWKFTLPEALAIVERVSHQLGAFVSDSIPLGDRMTVGQFLRVYRWRSAINVAEHAYDLWRIIRLMNPAAAATQEIREQLTRRAYDWGREELAKRLVQAYVREVGRAAIDLYSGRMRLTKGGTLRSVAPEAAMPDHASAVGRGEGPIRILVAGPPGSGKSSLIGALLDDAPGAAGKSLSENAFALYVGPSGGRIETLLIDSPGVSEAKKSSDPLLAAVGQSDLIIWVTPAMYRERDAERRVLERIRRQTTRRVDRKPPPILCVLSHIDALRTSAEGPRSGDPAETSASIPADTSNAKVAAINDAISAASRDLNFPVSEIIPVSLRAGASDNINAVRQRIVELLPEANSARLLRLVEAAEPKLKWGRLLSQVVNAGRALKSSAKR